MKKHQSAPKLKQRAFSIGDYHDTLIDTLITKHGFVSGSDVVRQGIIKLYNSLEPPYRKPTPAGRLKERAIEEIEEIESTSEEDYAKDTLGLLVFETEDGNKLVMYRGLGHTANFIPLDGIKEWGDTHKIEITFHEEDTRNESDEQFLSRPGVRNALERNKIVI